MAMENIQRGGARPRAGRKPKRTKYELTATQAENKIVDHLPAILDNLIYLANGGYERVEEEWQPAGLIMRTVEKEDGTTYQIKAFPDLDPETPVMVRRKVSTADKDRAANIYLVDRILGKPTQKQDIDLTAKGIQITVRHVNHAPSE
jgi:hypothetical protein